MPKKGNKLRISANNDATESSGEQRSLGLRLKTKISFNSQMR